MLNQTLGPCTKSEFAGSLTSFLWSVYAFTLWNACLVCPSQMTDYPPIFFVFPAKRWSSGMFFRKSLLSHAINHSFPNHFHYFDRDFFIVDYQQ